MAKVVLIGTMDSKGTEYEYAKACLLDAGAEVITVDCSLLSAPAFPVDITAEEVAQAAGFTLKEIQFDQEGDNARGKAISVMGTGAGIVLQRLLAGGKAHAVFGMGGSGGTNMLASAMRKLPIGVPKMLVSTIMAGNIRPIANGIDLTMMNSVTDISGINRISRMIISNAAYCAYGMALGYEKRLSHPESSSKPVVGISMFGVTTKGVMKVREKLERRGFEVICYHANGTGGYTMDRMAEEGTLDGVIDFTTAEVTAHYAGGKGDGGPDRMTHIAAAGIPWVAVTGALDLSNYYSPNDIPPAFKGPGRHMIKHNETTYEIRMLAEDFKTIGKVWAQKVSASRGPVSVLFPLKGMDAINEPGGPWYSPEDDAVLYKTIKQCLRKDIPLYECEMHINSDEFAERVVDAFMENWEKCHG